MSLQSAKTRQRLVYVLIGKLLANIPHIWLELLQYSLLLPQSRADTVQAWSILISDGSSCQLTAAAPTRPLLPFSELNTQFMIFIIQSFSE